MLLDESLKINLHLRIPRSISPSTRYTEFHSLRNFGWPYQIFANIRFVWSCLWTHIRLVMRTVVWFLWFVFRSGSIGFVVLGRTPIVLIIARQLETTAIDWLLVTLMRLEVRFIQHSLRIPAGRLCSQVLNCVFFISSALCLFPKAWNRGFSNFYCRAVAPDWIVRSTR